MRGKNLHAVFADFFKGQHCVFLRMPSRVTDIFSLPDSLGVFRDVLRVKSVTAESKIK